MKKYVVREGDTIWSISKETGVKSNLLLAANPQLKNPNQLRPGMVLVIPELNKPASASGKTGSLSPMSSQPGGPGTEQVGMNTQTPATQGPGQGMTAKGVPAQGASAANAPAQGTSASGQEHVPPFFGFVWPHRVEQGDSWASLQQQYNVPVSQLKHLNPSMAHRELQAGDVVYVPGLVPGAASFGSGGGHTASPVGPGLQQPQGTPSMSPSMSGGWPTSGFPGVYPGTPGYPMQQGYPGYPGAMPSGGPMPPYRQADEADYHNLSMWEESSWESGYDTDTRSEADFYDPYGLSQQTNVDSGPVKPQAGSSSISVYLGESSADLASW